MDRERRFGGAEWRKTAGRCSGHLVPDTSEYLFYTVFVTDTLGIRNKPLVPKPKSAHQKNTTLQLWVGDSPLALPTTKASKKKTILAIQTTYDLNARVSAIVTVSLQTRPGPKMEGLVEVSVNKSTLTN